MQNLYDVFHWTWGKKRYIQRRLVLADARELCRKWNASHEPGELSDKAEFEESEG